MKSAKIVKKCEKAGFKSVFDEKCQKPKKRRKIIKKTSKSRFWGSKKKAKTRPTTCILSTKAWRAQKWGFGGSKRKGQKTAIFGFFRVFGVQNGPSFSNLL